MGFLEELGIDSEEIETAGFNEPEAGFYQFEISAAAVVEGTSKDADVVKFRIDYACFNDDDSPAGTKSEWWTLFEKAGEEAGETATKSRGYLKSRLLDLGFTKPLNEIELDEIEGITGTLRLAPNGDYTNVRNVKVSKASAPAKTTASKAAASGKPNPFKKS